MDKEVAREAIRGQMPYWNTEYKKIIDAENCGAINGEEAGIAITLLLEVVKQRAIKSITKE